MITLNKITITGFLALGLLWLTACSNEQNLLSVNPSKINFSEAGRSVIVNIQTNAASWSIDNTKADWVDISVTNGTALDSSVTLTVSTKTLEPRLDTIIVTAGDAAPVEIIVYQPSSEYLYDLTSDTSNLSINQEGGSALINISTNAPQWNITSNATWLQFDKTTGNAGINTIRMTVTDNTGKDPRSTVITFSAESAPSPQITVSQKGNLFPNYNTSPINPDATGMGSTAMEISNKIKAGWNIGNTLEATGGETNWGNPTITNDLIKIIKQSGFNAIRLPCSWNQNADQTTAEIKSSWLNRVKDVVQYCVNNDMYVILNIHWDGGWLENNCTLSKKEVNNAKQKAFWEQIATQLRDFDEHLLFASANEPNVSDATQMGVLLSYHQTFIDAVRSTGGKNAYRVLVVQGPNTDIETTNKLMTQLPNDIIPNRMMAEIHYYTPWNFTGMTKDESWGNMAYYWGKDYHSTTDAAHNSTWGEEAEVDRLFLLMKNQFVNKGIPVVVGEYGAMRRDNLTGDALKLHLASRAYYIKYVTNQAIANGLLPFFWDTGGAINRTNYTITDQQTIDALILK